MSKISLIHPHSTLLFIIHSVFHTNSLILKFFQITWRKIIQTLYNRNQNFMDIQLLTKSLKKLPSHVAFSIDETDEIQDMNFDVKALAKVMSWTLASGISIISLYDSNGYYRENHTELQAQLEKEIANLGLPKVNVKFHNTSKATKDLQGVEKLDTLNKLHIIVFSSEDGKQGIVNTVRRIIQQCHFDETLLPNNNRIVTDMSENKDFSVSSEITEDQINLALDVSLEPDLLVVFGSSSSTLGFLPWHIRLTEIHWLPTFPTIILDDYTEVLRSFAACDQKVGK